MFLCARSEIIIRSNFKLIENSPDRFSRMKFTYILSSGILLLMRLIRNRTPCRTIRGQPARNLKSTSPQKTKHATETLTRCFTRGDHRGFASLGCVNLK